MAALPEEINLNEAEDGKVSYQIYEKEGENYIFAYDYVRQGKNEMYRATQTDISAVIEKQKSMIAYFQRIYIVILCISFPIIFLLTKALTASLKKVGEASRRIAQGNYSQRIWAQGKDEIGGLASDFNRMAGQVEEKIAELSDAARQKEDFAAKFVNAVTGQVWSADIILYENLPKEIPYEKLNDFLELSGLKVSEPYTEEELWQPNRSWMELVEIEGSKLYAEMQFINSQTGYPGGGYGKEGLLNFRSKNRQK